MQEDSNFEMRGISRNRSNLRRAQFRGLSLEKICRKYNLLLFRLASLVNRPFEAWNAKESV